MFWLLSYPISYAGKPKQYFLSLFQKTALFNSFFKRIFFILILKIGKNAPKKIPKTDCNIIAAQIQFWLVFNDS